jgi:hypothetical protein
MSKDNEKEKQGGEQKPKQEPKKILEVPIITDKNDAQNSFDKTAIITQSKKE